MIKPLDINFVRQHFPAYNDNTLMQGHFFDSAAGSFPCLGTIESLHEFYQTHKVQPSNLFAASELAAEEMLYAKIRWAEALGVKENEIGFGPSTTQNIYVLASAFREYLKPGDEIVITNQDHESNIGAMQRAALAAGATVKIWEVDSQNGTLSLSSLEPLLSSATQLVCFPHSSNIIGEKNNADEIIALVHAHNALAMVDGVSYVPHEIPDLSKLKADIYVFSLYKVYSVHQGVLVVRESTLEKLPQQGHFFKEAIDVSERLIPAGPDHAQVAASGAVLEYIETLSAFHGGPITDLRQACDFVSTLWRNHEMKLLKPLLSFFESANNFKLIGTTALSKNRCPLVSFVSLQDSSDDLLHILCDQGMLLSAGHFYAPRLLDAVGVNSESGVIRISMAHYNDEKDVALLISRLQELDGA